MFEDRQGAKTKGFGFKKLGARFWILVLDFVALGITYFVPGFFLSLYIAEHGLGDVAYAGIALSVDTLAALSLLSFLTGAIKSLEVILLWQLLF